MPSFPSKTEALDPAYLSGEKQRSQPRGPTGGTPDSPTPVGASSSEPLPRQNLIWSQLRSTSPSHIPYERMSLDEIETVQVPDLGPCRDKVFHKLLLRVRERVNLRERPKLGM
jgi:hypothetical protein